MTVPPSVPSAVTLSTSTSEFLPTEQLRHLSVSCSAQWINMTQTLAIIGYTYAPLYRAIIVISVLTASQSGSVTANRSPVWGCRHARPILWQRPWYGPRLIINQTYSFDYFRSCPHDSSALELGPCDAWFQPRLLTVCGRAVFTALSSWLPFGPEGWS